MGGLKTHSNLSTVKYGLKTIDMKARHEFESDEAYRDYLRTYFAAMAMQGVLSHNNPNNYKPNQSEDIVRLSIALSDELLKQLEDANP